MYQKILIVLAVILALVSCDYNSSEILLRNKRIVTWPYNTAVGMTVALALPLNIPDRNVFYAFNFEANYNMPSPINAVETVIPGPLNGPLHLVEPSDERQLNEDHTKVRRSLWTRKKAYTIFEKKLTSSGFKGRACLLRSICETAHIPVNHHNGVLGDILHVILSPSTSMEENLHPEFYLAEKLGETGNCTKYQEKCELNFLDLASTVVHSMF